MAALSSLQARECPMIIFRQMYQVPYPVLCTSIMWQNIMAYRLFCIPTTPRTNGCHGSADSLMQEQISTRKRDVPCFLPTCWTFLKNLLKRIFLLPYSFIKGWHRWAWVSK